MEGRQHRTGVATVDLKLTLGGASKGCVHEVTGRKPRWWAVMEEPSKQFQRDFSCAVFLILVVKLSDVDHFFNFFPPKMLMIPEMKNVSTQFFSKSKSWP